MFRAGRLYGTVIFKKAQTGLLEGYINIIEQRADFALRILNQTLMDDAVNPPRQRFVHRLHHPDIIAIILAKVRQIITERLPAREMLFEVGKTTIHRVPSCINDFGVGQYLLNKGHMHPIIGHLVDKKWLVRLAVDAGAADIFFAQSLPVIAAECGKFGQKIAIVPVPPPRCQPLYHHADIGQLLGTFDV